VVHALLDATAIPVDRGGVGRYLDGLIPELATVEGLQLTVVCQQHDAELYRRSGATVVAAPARIAGRGPRLAWEQLALPALVRTVGAEVLHSPHYTMPLRAGVPVVVTVHDATFFSDPDLHTGLKRRFFATATKRAVRRAAGLVVPSQATRTELCRLVSPRAERAVVAPHGVDAQVFHPPTEAEVLELRRTLGLGDQPFVAFLGTIEPRKNVANLIRGWAKACTGMANPPALVVAGGKGWDASVDPAIAAVDGALRLIRPGYLPVQQLRALLGGADIVAYPALGEGFGLPVLEAMACGAAVLTTRRLSLPEVGGDAAAYCEVEADSIGQALAALLADPDRRIELSKRARDRAATFTWARSAAIHAEAYQQAVLHDPG
jgi:glycosyltransferase involved in cell wall biosynthesis